MVVGPKRTLMLVNRKGHLLILILRNLRNHLQVVLVESRQAHPVEVLAHVVLPAPYVKRLYSHKMIPQIIHI